MLRRMDRRLGSPSRGVVYGLAVLLVGLVGVCDYLSGYELSLSFLYLVPIGLGAWLMGGAAGVCLSLLSALVWVAVDITSGHPYSQAWIPFWNAGIRLGFFLVTSGLLVAVRRELRHADRLARTDPLTGTLNVRALREDADRLLSLCSREALAVTVVFLDLDDFKKVNDQGGHAEGNRVLAAVSAAILQTVRRHDVVCRVGGDEFALLLPGADHDQAGAILGRLTAVLAEVPTTGGQSVKCSLGAVTYLTPPKTLDEALAEADALMYRVKTHGKGSFLHEVRA